MKFADVFKDKICVFWLYIIILITNTFLMRAFKTQLELIICIDVMFSLFYVADMVYDYMRKKKYYNELINNINGLEQKYFVCETLREPEFYEGKIQQQILNEINHSMIENVKKYRIGMENFKEYVEMWIHEIKLPVASLTLILHNFKENEFMSGGSLKEINDTEKLSVYNSNSLVEKMSHQVNRINNYIEQILYYVRSENAEKDYIISECRLSKIISSVALKNKDEFLEKNINLAVENVTYDIYTDTKWLEFMLNQILSNSIKYTKDNGCVSIYAEETAKSVILNIKDNGIGISKADLPRVFDKSFTGENGREYSKATGMGLYIVKKLGDKLGHKISIESVKGEYTLVKMEFFRNDFYRETMGSN